MASVTRDLIWSPTQCITDCPARNAMQSSRQFPRYADLDNFYPDVASAKYDGWLVTLDDSRWPIDKSRCALISTWNTPGKI